MYILTKFQFYTVLFGDMPLFSVKRLNYMISESVIINQQYNITELALPVKSVNKSDQSDRNNKLVL